MLWIDTSRTPADRLVKACFNGDLPAAKALVVDGASVNEEGWLPAWGEWLPPLTPAVSRSHRLALRRGCVVTVPRG